MMAAAAVISLRMGLIHLSRCIMSLSFWCDIFKFHAHVYDYLLSLWHGNHKSVEPAPRAMCRGYGEYDGAWPLCRGAAGAYLQISHPCSGGSGGSRSSSRRFSSKTLIAMWSWWSRCCRCVVQSVDWLWRVILPRPRSLLKLSPLPSGESAVCQILPNVRPYLSLDRKGHIICAIRYRKYEKI